MIFFAKLICEQEGKEVEIDSRTSDAIALAVRFECPIYTFEFVLSSAGIILDDDDAEDLEDINNISTLFDIGCMELFEPSANPSPPTTSIEKLVENNIFEISQTETGSKGRTRSPNPSYFGDS